MKPSICRFVVYHFMDADSKKMVERPALVTSVGKFDQVSGEHLANLHVFFEPGDIEEGFGFSDLYEYGSLFRGNVQAGHADPLRTPTPGTWTWPQRV